MKGHLTLTQKGNRVKGTLEFITMKSNSQYPLPKKNQCQPLFWKAVLDMCNHYVITDAPCT